MIRAPRSMTERDAAIVAAGFQPAVGWALAQLQAHPRPLRPATQVRQPQCAALVAASFQLAKPELPRPPLKGGPPMKGKNRSASRQIVAPASRRRRPPSGNHDHLSKEARR